MTAVAQVDTPEMTEARVMGVTALQLMQDKLRSYDKPEFPGIQSWLAKEGKQLQALDKEKPTAAWKKLRSSSLTQHSANFWQMYYEVVPGDPGLAMLHAGTMLAAGDADRAQTVLRLTLHRDDLDKNTRQILSSIMQHCGAFMIPSRKLVNDGIAFHDKGDHAAALAKYDDALALWPLNGWATYERGFTLMTRAAKADDEEVKKAFSKSREMQPFQWAAWQGTVKDIPGMMVMHKVVRPLWEESLKDIKLVMKAEDMKVMSEALQEAEVDDLALVTRQIFIIRRGRYMPEDHPFISKSLRRLVPGVQAEKTIARLAGPDMVTAQIFAPPVPDSAKRK